MSEESPPDSDHNDDGHDNEPSRFKLKPTGPIPSELYSFYEDRPFRSCTRCGEGLFDFKNGYRVSKVYKGDEVIFEYALCVPCLQNMMEESSEESRQRLYDFQMSRIRQVAGFDECALCDRVEEYSQIMDYGLVGICLGEAIVEANKICGLCMEEMSELVSKKTRESWNRFVDENFPGVPADLEAFPIRNVPSLL